MSIIETGFRVADFNIGIDPATFTQVALAIDEQGLRPAAISVPTNSKDYIELNNWCRSVPIPSVSGPECYRSDTAQLLPDRGLPLQTMRGRQLRFQYG